MEITISESIRSVLLVEDEAIVAMLMEDLLREMGVRQVEVRADLEGACAIARAGNFDFAVLDLRVRGGETAEVADILCAREIPFVFSTGAGVESLPSRHRDRPAVIKPFADDDFRRMILDTWMEWRPQGFGRVERVASSSVTD